MAFSPQYIQYLPSIFTALRRPSTSLVTMRGLAGHGPIFLGVCLGEGRTVFFFHVRRSFDVATPRRNFVVPL